MVEVIGFQDAIAAAQAYKKRHLLLGNGFSISCCPEIFTYGSLFKQANFTETPVLPKVFKTLGIQDFEHVIRVLDDAAKILPIYAPTEDAAASTMASNAAKLKDILIKTVANNHPAIPSNITEQKFWSCRKFLEYFLGGTNKSGRVYTLNYDLLLYWTLMHDDEPFAPERTLNINDGFGRDEYTDPEYVDWMGEGDSYKQRLHYLHGALHLFDAGSDLQKYTWSNTGKPLLEQAREAMQSNKFPLFVSEGSSRQKLKKIKHSAYLYHSYKCFSRQMEQRNDCLFIFGHSLATNDNHILKKIISGKIPRVFVSLYGNYTTDENKEIIKNTETLQRRRVDEDNPLEVSFFDAASANVWGTA